VAIGKGKRPRDPNELAKVDIHHTTSATRCTWSLVRVDRRRAVHELFPMTWNRWRASLGWYGSWFPRERSGALLPSACCSVRQECLTVSALSERRCFN